MSTTESVTKTVSTEDRIEGPIPEFDRYNDYTGYDYYRCRACGREAMEKRDLADGRCDCGGSR